MSPTDIVNPVFIWITTLVIFPVLPAIPEHGSQERSPQTIKLLPPRHAGGISVEEALSKRRSVREFRKGPLSLREVSQLLWAAQGISGKQGKRTAPSAGALYPLDVYIISTDVELIPNGIYHYQPATHTIELRVQGDRRKFLAAAAGMQSALSGGSAILVITAKYHRTTVKYGERGKRYVHMEAGHAAQNVALQAVSLGLNTVTIGAFSDALVKKIMQLPADETPLYLMPLGK